MIRILRRPALGCAAALASAAVPGCGGPPPAPERPDVVVVVVDTLRADRLPFHGGPAPAPFLAELASRSLVFDDVWSTSSWTAPATASLFTSLHPFEHGVETGLVHHEHHREGGTRLRALPPDVETLPEVMRRLGYRTFGIADNVNVGSRLGFDRGFDRFAQTDYAGADAVDRALAEWSEEIRGSERPTFVYLHYMDPHEPYHLRAEHWTPPRAPALALGDVLVPGEPPSFHGDEMVSWIEAGDPAVPLAERARQAREAMLSVYDSEIGWVDRHVREAFEELGVDEETLVVFLSDHGEEFGDHGHTAHGFRLYGELVRVPLLVRLPHAARRGRVGGAFSLVDVLPTLRRFLADPLPAPDRGADLFAPAPSEPRPLFAARRRVTGEADEELRAVRRGRYKAIFHDPSGRAELYDLAADPGETADVATSQPERTEALRAAWEELAASSPPVRRSEPRRLELGPEEIERLRELGYAERGGG